MFSYLSTRSNGLKSGKRQRNMPLLMGLGVSLLLLNGCVTDAEFLAQNSSAALNAAESRGKFELNCPQVTTSVLSQKIDQGLRAGFAWTEYTIGVRGCGKEAVYVTVCRDQDNCNALAQTGRVLENTP